MEKTLLILGEYAEDDLNKINNVFATHHALKTIKERHETPRT